MRESVMLIACHIGLMTTTSALVLPAACKSHAANCAHIRMGLLDQLFEDWKAAREVNEKPAVEAMPQSINQRPYVRASHILLASAESAEELCRRIEANELSFEDAASQFSLCRTKSKGGSLGSFKSLARYAHPFSTPISRRYRLSLF